MLTPFPISIFIRYDAFGMSGFLGLIRRGSFLAFTLLEIIIKPCNTQLRGMYQLTAVFVYCFLTALCSLTTPSPSNSPRDPLIALVAHLTLLAGSVNLMLSLSQFTVLILLSLAVLFLFFFYLIIDRISFTGSLRVVF